MKGINILAADFRGLFLIPKETDGDHFSNEAACLGLLRGIASHTQRVATQCMVTDERSRWWVGGETVPKQDTK